MSCLSQEQAEAFFCLAIKSHGLFFLLTRVMQEAFVQPPSPYNAYFPSMRLMHLTKPLWTFFPSVKNRSLLRCIAHLCLLHRHSQVSLTLAKSIRTHSTLPSRTPEDQTCLLVLHSILCSYPPGQHGYRPHCAVFAHTTLPLTSTELLSE